ncbi:MAG: DUF883 C-terminal domain-containing protein [Methanomicrobiales archaeon]
MSNETSDIVETSGDTPSDRDMIQTAEALEEAAHRLRSANISANCNDVNSLLNDVKLQVLRIKREVSNGYGKDETDYQKKIEPVEQVIITHPIPSILIAAGIGVLIGMLLFKNRD